MKTKQWMGLLAVFCIAALGVLMARSAAEINEGGKQTNKFSLNAFSENLPILPYISEINITGEMAVTSPANVFGVSQGYQHNAILEHIDNIIADDNNKGILLNVDSPGGEAYAADELYLKLYEYKNSTNRPIYVTVASMAASGGYYAALAGDKIYANRSSWVGSIGVYIQLTDTTRLEKFIGVKRFLISSSENKGMGLSFKKLTPEQRNIYQGLIDNAYDVFLQVFKKGRGITDDKKAREIADGRVYTAEQAVEVNMIDGIMNRDEVFAELCGAAGYDSLELYNPADIFDFWKTILGTASAFSVKGDAELIKEYIEDNGNGKVMYRAEGIE